MSHDRMRMSVERGQATLHDAVGRVLDAIAGEEELWRGGTVYPWRDAPIGFLGEALGEALEEAVGPGAT